MFGIAAALLYGVTDFVARFANKSNGVVKTLLWGQGLLAVLLTVAVILVDHPVSATIGEWSILMASNLMIMAGTACLYHGLATGRLAVVAPVMSGYGAISGLLALASGSAITLLGGAGLALTAVGAVLAAASPRKDRDIGNGRPSGWLPAAGAAVMYGGAYWIQGTWSLPVFGALDTLWSYYLSGTLVFGLVAAIRRQDMRLDGVKGSALIFGTALLAAGGYFALSFSQMSGGVAIGPALGATASAITVMLAFVFLREKVAWPGWLGVASVVAGVAALHLGK
ncbi:hypothetical protein ABI_46190 [Asticcacaulis biprosthecium C19]|uniref:EamA domain-containing protein n=1 Tax=Asticcacaulis biprosthecium C19 TaxID=715226 RepID=F4QTX1_9CAUL|nr:EamA family transporter [Asticcacaulis biprosthecium]EGF89271.1 hypothetical protein ABI_46190 [Asticcacaulis biprosthecium C19]